MNNTSTSVCRRCVSVSELVNSVQYTMQAACRTKDHDKDRGVVYEVRERHSLLFWTKTLSDTKAQS